MQILSYIIIEVVTLFAIINIVNCIINQSGGNLMDRSKALEHLKLRNDNDTIIKHSLAVEAIMRKLATALNEHENLWGITGLVHDIDIGRIDGDMTLHGNVAAEILELLNYDSTIIYAVRAHNPLNKLKRRRKIDKALFCSSPIAAFINECVITTENKNLNDLDINFILDCYNNKEFAKNIKRDEISSCTELDLSLEEFIKLSLGAMQEISHELE
jgi:putative nucleotidyltransferase with HDIG domain